MGKQRKIPKIAKRFKKILKGKERGKGEGLTKTVGLTKGQGLASLPPGLTLESIVKKIPKGKKLKKTIFKTAQKGTKESDMKKNKYRGGYHNQRSNNNNNKTDPMSVQKNAVEKQLKNKSKKLEFPKTTGAFKIEKGDSLSKISKMTGKSIKEIMAANKDITDPNKIRAGAGLKGLGKRSDYTTKIVTKKDNMPINKPGTATSNSAVQINRELKDKINPPKPTTDIFKVKKGESTTKAADAKKKQEEALKKVGRSYVVPGKATRKKLSNKERKNQQLARLSFRAAQAMKPGEGREKAMARARKIQQRNLPKKTTKNYPAENLVKKGRIIFGTDKKENRLASKMNRGGFIKTGDGDKFVKKAYGGRVGS